MIINERGVLKNSCAYFHTPSTISKSMFFYLFYVGHFYCNNEYSITRDNYDSFLIMFVKKGRGTVNYNNKNYDIKENDVVFINCHRPHSYKSKDDNLEIYWIHFDGSTSNEYFQYIYNKYGVVISLKEMNTIPKYIDKIIEYYKNNTLINEPLVSCYIQRILTDILINSNGNKIYSNENSPIFSAINFIQKNYKYNISVEDLANHICLSVYYFSRLFKRETGYSPYQYIRNVRLNHAKSLLISTDMPIKEICYECGFNSESNFVSCFKAQTGITPSNFRDLSI